MLPYRHATRFVNAFQAYVGGIGIQLIGRDLDQMVALLFIWRAALRDPHDVRISVNALATSLRRPFETMRRAVIGLAEQGFCEKAARGVRRAPRFLEHPAIVAPTAPLCDALRVLGDDLRRLGFAVPPQFGPCSDAVLVAAALDVYLSVFELTESRITTPLVLYVLGIVTVGNADRLTHDPVLGLRYGYDDTVPPDELRRPVPISEIAAAHGFPYSTIWRHLVRLEKTDAVRKVGGGYLLGDLYVNNPLTSLKSREKIHYVRRVLNDVAKARGSS